MESFLYTKVARPPIRVSSHALERYALRVHPGTRCWLWREELKHRLATEGRVRYGPPDWLNTDDPERWFILLDANTVVPLDSDPDNPDAYIATTIMLRRLQTHA